MQNRPMNARRLLFPLAAAGLVASASSAQDLVPKAAAQTRPIVLRHATLHTVSHGVLEDTDLVFADGRIRSIGSGLASAGAEEIDARGKHVYPGFVCVSSALGLTEVGSIDMTIDTSEAGALNPEVWAAVAVNPDSWLFPVARCNGVLTAGVMPQGGLVPGRMSVVRLDGWTWEDMAIERDAGLVVNWPFMGTGGGRFGFFRRRGGDEGGDQGRSQIAQLDSLLDAASAYLAAREADPSVKTDERLEGLASTLSGRTPVYVNVTTAEQIESAVLWAAKRKLRIVLLGARDADHCVELLKRHDVFVALLGTHRLPQRRDLSYAEPFELPGRLEASGVRWCLTMADRDSSNVRNLPYEAAAAVAFGLDPEVALRSVTLSAAECLGLGDQLGSLDEGKRATFFVADGDPFEFTTTIESAFIDGRRIDLRSKQTELAAKYREKYRQLGLIPREDEAVSAAPSSGSGSGQ